MAVEQGYQIHTDVKFAFPEVMDVSEIMAGVQDAWFNQTLFRVNDSVIRLGIVQGEFHWHKHDDEDEFFYVVEGRLFVDVEDRPSVELGPRQGFLVPKGLLHRTRAPHRTAMLMIASAGVRPTGD